ncbi:hypothetical protein [Salipiger sp. PrR003]|uniref:hypothetical protein n=1 Tax=Salipiger sp. PrR003 TaxID=2706776 RepID=UPI0013D9DE8C|nr:hypothetical protein [Salipiger sp. PrR003]NDV50823.1 hypothetical protein [Salipiger sp. PrR003]
MKFRKLKIQHLTILIPALLVAIYLFVLAGDRFVSESRFTIKSQGEVSAATSLDLGILGGASAAKQDQLLVRDYILSRDMMEAVFDEFGADALSGPFVDQLWYVSEGSPVKAKLSHYRAMIDFTFDEEAAVSTLETNAFDPETARDLNEFLIHKAEDYINAFARTSSDAMISYTQKDLERAQAQVLEITDQIRQAQSASQMVDPETDIGVVAKTLAELEAALASAKGELGSLETYLQDDTHQVVAQKRKIANLEEQIEEMRNRMSGDKAGDLADATIHFNMLNSQLQFANEDYASARKTLEMAKIQAMQATKHLVIIDHPDLADFAAYPRRLLSFLFALTVIAAFAAMTRMVAVLLKDY